MGFLSRKSTAADRDLSAFLDGELDDDRVALVGERLVFDRDYRNRRDELAAACTLWDAATAAPVPASSAFAARLEESLSADPVSRSADTVDPPARARRRRLNPALLASLGVIITAGVTFAGLRRRGLV